MAECFGMQQSFVIDNTNPAPEHRKPYIEAAKAKGYILKAYYFDMPFDDCKAQNENREAKVPMVALYSTRKRLVPPTVQEGFDEVLTVTKNNFLYEV
jgi:predicted kinase